MVFLNVVMALLFLVCVFFVGRFFPFRYKKELLTINAQRAFRQDVVTRLCADTSWYCIQVESATPVGHYRPLVLLTLKSAQGAHIKVTDFPSHHITQGTEVALHPGFFPLGSTVWDLLVHPWPISEQAQS